MEYSDIEGPAPENTEAKKTGGLERGDGVFLLGAFIVCFAFFEFVLFGGLGFGVPIFFAVFYAIAVLYLGRGRRVITRESVLSFVPVAVLAVCFALFDNGVLRALNVMALWLCAAQNLLAAAGLSHCPLYFAGNLRDMLAETFYWPFLHLTRRFGSFVSASKGPGRRRGGIVALTLVCVSPVAAVVLLLLASSDASFSGLLNRVFGALTADFWIFVLKIVLSALLTFPLFNLLYALRHREKREKVRPEAQRPLDPLAASTALGVFSAIYALYIAVQADYFFSALRGVLPASFTYAGYARRGFFELVAVVCINFCLLAVVLFSTRRAAPSAEKADGDSIFGGRLPKGPRVSALVLCGFTLLLIVTAASKMAMYIGVYGLTPLRVYTSFFMLFLFSLVIFLSIKMLAPRFDFRRAVAFAAVALYLALNLSDVDALVARRDVGLYRETGKFDMQLAYTLSDDALPQVAQLAGDKNYGGGIRALLRERRELGAGRKWQDEDLGFLLARRVENY